MREKNEQKKEINQSVEFWLLIKLRYPKENPTEKCYEIAFCILNELETKSAEISDFNLKSFHYFFEEEFEIRIEVDIEVQIQQAKKICENIIEKSIFNNKAEYVTDYKGEWNCRDKEMKGYGAPWLVVKKFFDASSRFKLMDLFSTPILPESNNAKLIHCFLNQQGTIKPYKEIVEYFNLFWTRYVNFLFCEESNIHLTDFVKKNKKLLEALGEFSSLIEKGKFKEAKEKYKILENKPNRIETLDI